MKLTNVKFTLNDKPMKTLLWCNKVPKGKRNKPSKINGIQHHEISNSVGDDFVAIVSWKCLHELMIADEREEVKW